MCSSIESRYNHFFAKQEILSYQERLRKNGKVIVSISPSKFEKQIGKIGDPKAFSKDCDRLNKVLVVDNQTIYSAYKKEFNELDQLCQMKEEIDLVLENKESLDPELISLLENQAEQLDRKYEDKKSSLREKIDFEFKKYLEIQLGPKRKHLTDEICWRFSQNALIMLDREVDSYAAKSFKGLFRGGHIDHSCTLHIPKDPAKPVQITATTDGFYNQFIPLDDTGEKRTIDPVQLKSYGVYTIKLSGKTVGKVEFSLLSSKPALKMKA